MKKEHKNTILTGDRPTGKLHLGHYVGSILNRVKLQDEHAGNSFYMVADMQALTDNADDPEKVRDNMLEVVLDNLACGLDPKKTTIFVQSGIPERSELSLFFLNLVTLARLKRNPTVKSEMKQKGYEEDVPAGFLAYPVDQAADILFCKGNIVPVGEDQLPVIEQCNEIGEKFNKLYGEVFPKIKPLVGTHARLVGIDGNAKMSKSLGNTIYISATDKEIEEKVNQMYTDPGHIKASDPGKVEGNVVFAYLDIFDPNKTEVADLKKQYEKGGLGDVVLKKRLTQILIDLVTPIRTRRETLAKDKDAILAIVKEGTEKARKVAIETLEEAKKAMKIDYF